MTSRIHIARPATATYNADPHGFSNSRSTSGYRAANPDDPLEKLRAMGKQVEDAVEIYSQPLKPHLPSIGRFLIVVTFYEDALRIITQWSDQLWYLQSHFYWGFSHLFLIFNVIVMLAASTAVVSKRYTEHAVLGLFAVVLVQGFGYGLIFDLNFFLRNLSVIGGLVMVFSETMVSRKNNFPGLPSVSETDRKKYFLLAGRVLLIFLFLGYMVQGKWSIGRFIVSLIGLAACTMVAVGFKAKWSATFLVIVLSIFNVFINNWWSVHSAHPQRDFLKYDFFQTLSIVGGLILLVNMGPGKLPYFWGGKSLVPSRVYLDIQGLFCHVRKFLHCALCGPTAMVATKGDVKVYTVNGAVAGSSSSIPDWLTRKRAAKAKGKRVLKEREEGRIELIQGFEFPEASNKVKTTRDGHHALATGTYKPQIRVWDLDELTMKFERHTDAENVDFIILSDDWTKTIHLQNDRSVELHTQGGFHYRTRIPRFGRSLAYHFPSCDALISASGNEVYRLNLEQGRFLNPIVLDSPEGDSILGVNCIDINPAHQLLGFGIDGTASVQFWDSRSRSRVGLLDLPKGRISRPSGRAVITLPGVDDEASRSEVLSVTAIASRSDGLSYAVGTSTGLTLLYDIRSPRPFAFKDQGYGLPVKNVAWIEGGSRMAGDGMVLTADKKVVKIWDRNTPSSNFVSITPATDLNHIHHIPGSGLLLTANEGIHMAAYYIPQLGPAPRWATFLENITEEMEDQSTRNVYEDYKFIERNELRALGLDHLIGTPALKPYMHGYFVSLKLYDTARVISNPFAYAEHREKLVKERMDKLADSRIRTRKDGTGVSVKVNRALAEKIQKDAEREKRKEEKKRTKKAREAAEGMGDSMVIDEEALDEVPVTLLSDPRFKELFENPEFSVDENSREYALLNPSAVAQRSTVPGSSKTAVEEEEEESVRSSSDGLSGSSEDESSDDSSDAGELTKFDPRTRPEQKNLRAEQQYARAREANRQRVANVSLVPIVPRTITSAGNLGDKDATFGQRLASRQATMTRAEKPSDAKFSMDGGVEMTFIPSSSAGDDRPKPAERNNRKKGVEVLGATMERGGEEPTGEMNEGEKRGRTHRRKGQRSGSRNTFRMLSS
ncbi:hypothetical protein ID866_4180 [Astraeus odoratus]|nr:hypothetical protein ID866_4180 [Astraeus odoratus]